jgi:23S rRNA pseudouridine1911/1915/1917 synthase
MRRVVADRAGRADAVLAGLCPDLSRARLQRLMAEGEVTRNGVPVSKAETVEAGDEIVFAVPETVHAAAAPAFDLPVIFEDQHLLAVDKPANLPVHGAPGDLAPSVAGWFLARLGAAAGAFDAEHPGVVHRLDKDTSGILVLAKTPPVQGMLSRAFEERTVIKRYVAVCDGAPPREHAIVDAAIGRHPGDRTRMALVKHGRESRTEYEVLATERDRSLVLVRPSTGRTHQIRVHLAAIGAPVRYDRVYGKPGAGRQLLHAWELIVPHPAGGTLTMRAPVPADMAHELRTLAPGDTIVPYLEPATAALEAES